MFSEPAGLNILLISRTQAKLDYVAAEISSTYEVEACVAPIVRALPSVL